MALKNEKITVLISLLLVFTIAVFSVQHFYTILTGWPVGSVSIFVPQPNITLDTSIFNHPQTTRLEDIEDYSNIADFKIGVADYGLIDFEETLDLSTAIINFTQAVNISFNRIFLDTGLAPELNKRAVLTLTNLTFTNPRILKDGLVCPASICVIQSYSDGTLIFNVTGLTVYSSEETPSVAVAAPAAAVGGGLGAGKEVSLIEIDKPNIFLRLQPGQYLKDQFMIKNKINKPVSITIDFSNLADFLLTYTRTAQITLQAEASETLQLPFNIPLDTKPGRYFREIRITTQGSEYIIKIPVIIDVAPKERIFDTIVNVVDQYKKVMPGQHVLADITLIKFVPREELSTIYFSITDTRGNILVRESEPLFIKSKVDITRGLRVPPDTAPGQYIFDVSVETDGINVGQGSDTFEVTEEVVKVVAARLLPPGAEFITIIIPILVMLYIVLFRKKRFRLKQL